MSYTTGGRSGLRKSQPSFVPSPSSTPISTSTTASIPNNNTANNINSTYHYPIPTKPSSLNSRYAYPNTNNNIIINSNSNSNNYSSSATQTNSINTVNTRTSPSLNGSSPSVSTPPSTLQITPSSNSANGPCRGTPSLDELINYCFLHSIDQPLDPARLACVKKFESLVNKLHCQENLKFLIEIYTYEYYHDRIFPFSNSNHAEKVKRDRLNNTPSPSLSNYFSQSDQRLPRKVASKEDLDAFYSKSINTSISNLNIDRSSLRSEYPSQDSGRRESRSEKPTLSAPVGETVDDCFVSTIDDVDIPDESDLSQLNTKAWDDMLERQMEDDDKDDEDEDEEPHQITDLDKQLLESQWDLIISNYISHDAPDQINLSQQLYDGILEENKAQGIHPPWVLLKAKNAAMQLIKENAYLKFVHERKTAGASTSSFHSTAISNAINLSDTTNNRQASPPLSASAPPGTVSPNSGIQSPVKTPNSRATETAAGSPTSLVYDISIGEIMDTTQLVPKAASTLASPLLSPTTSHSHTHTHTHTSKSKPKKKTIHKTSQAQTILNENISSNSSSSSSISNLLGHLKLYHSTNPGTSTTPHSTSGSPNFLQSVSSTLHSLAGNPPEEDSQEPQGSSTFKFWSKKKH